MEKIIFFDLDGTIIDTLEDLNSATNFALSKFGFPFSTLKDTNNNIGNGILKLIERSVPKGTSQEIIKECYKLFLEYYSQHYLDKSKAYDGMKEVLLKLKERGYLLAVVTNKNDKIAKPLIENIYPNIFDYVQGEVDFLKKKPDREMIDFVIKKLDFKGQIAAYVGDAITDYETAITAQIPPILVTYGYHRDGFIEEMKIKNVPLIDTPFDLLKLFK